MATDGVKIIDGDLANDIYNIFMKMYDAGASVAEIRQAIEQPFDEEDGFDYEIYITVYALALWQTGQLTPIMLQEVDEVIIRGAGVKVWTEECDDKEGQKRQRELEKLREKISHINPRIRKRKPYKTITKFIFDEGAVLTFQLPDENYRVAILMEILQHQGKCTYYFIASTYTNAIKPTIKDIESGKLVGSRMPAYFDYQIGFSVIAVSPKILRSFANKFEQIGNIEIPPESKRVGVYGGGQSFESFCWNWENQDLHIKNLDLEKISLKEIK